MAVPSETTLLLVRHAHSMMAGRFCGHTDTALSDIGKKQLCDIANCLERWPISKVYTSDLKRAYDTAAAIAARKSLALRVREGLREISFGEWEGLSWTEIEARDPAAASLWLSDYPLQPAPGGESFQQYRSQVEAELQAVLKESEHGCVSVVTHAGFIRAALVSILSMSEKAMHKIEVDYGGITILRYAQQSWRVDGVNFALNS